MKIHLLLASAFALTSVALSGGLAANSAQAQAREYPWCVNHRGSQDCKYVSYQQCQLAASGWGICEANARTLFYGRR